VKLGNALERVRSSVEELADQLRVVGERHAAQQDVYHMGHTLSRRMEELALTLDPFLKAYGQDGTSVTLDADAVRAFTERVRRSVSNMTRMSAKTGMFLLRDLRELYVEASACEIDWTIARQGAMAARDQALVDVAVVGMDETKRVITWLKTRIKEASPQILMTAE